MAQEGFKIQYLKPIDFSKCFDTICHETPQEFIARVILKAGRTKDPLGTAGLKDYITFSQLLTSLDPFSVKSLYEAVDAYEQSIAPAEEKGWFGRTFGGKQSSSAEVKNLEAAKEILKKQMRSEIHNYYLYDWSKYSLIKMFEDTTGETFRE